MSQAIQNLPAALIVAGLGAVGYFAYNQPHGFVYAYIVLMVISLLIASGAIVWDRALYKMWWEIRPHLKPEDADAARELPEQLSPITARNALYWFVFVVYISILRALPLITTPVQNT